MKQIISELAEEQILNSGIKWGEGSKKGWRVKTKNPEAKEGKRLLRKIFVVHNDLMTSISLKTKSNLLDQICYAEKWDDVSFTA